jgi:hypothetical protein
MIAAKMVAMAPTIVARAAKIAKFRLLSDSFCGCPAASFPEAYAKASLKKYSPMAARNDDKNVFSGLL